MTLDSMRLIGVRLSLASLLSLGCGDPSPMDAGFRDAGTDAGPREWPAADVPERTTPEAGIVREVLVIDVSAAPANPATGDATPAGGDRMPVVRFYAEGAPDVRAVVVAMPGIFGGAGSFEMLARHLVRRSVAEGEPIEVWALDRRSNLLEDRRGLDAAEALEDPAVAEGYYRRGESIGGERFEGLLDQTDVPFMSEWGLETHLNDLRAVIERVPAAQRRARVFLMGHSLGASMTEAFLAWRFEDGVRGAELLAGAILVDGAASTEPLSESEYREGTSGGIMSVPGLDAIRGSSRFLALPLLGVDVYLTAEIAAMHALWSPDAVEVNPERTAVLAALMSLTERRVPAMSNAAAFGWAFDEGSNGLSFAAVSMGQPAGGPSESFASPFGGDLTRPSDPAATYTWIDALDADPPELTPLANLAHSWIDGRTGFAEWYFPTRLSLDLAAAGGLDLPDDGWAAAEGLRAFDGELVDAPVLAVAAALAPPARYEAMRARVAPVGDGRPNAGATRDSTDGFEVIDATALTHIDPLTAADVAANPVPPAVLAFVYANAEPGAAAVSLP